MTFTLNRAAFNRLTQSPTGEVGADILRRARAVETQAIRLCPVDTGRLRSSIHIEGPQRGRTGIAYDVVAATNYAIYVELGTRYMRPTHFLTDALASAVR